MRSFPPSRLPTFAPIPETSLDVDLPVASRRSSRLPRSGIAAVLTALLASVGVVGPAHATAVAQSLMDLSNFTFRQGNGNATVGGGLPLGSGMTITAVGNTADTFVNLDGTIQGNGGSGAGALSFASCVGTCGSYVAFTPLAGVPSANYVGSTSVLTGSGITSANAKLDNTVSLSGAGDGSAQGNVNLNLEFLITVAAVTSLEMNFNADVFLRAMLDQPGVDAVASYGWTTTLSREILPGVFLPVFSWSPDGIAGGVSGGTEYLDPFALNFTLSTLSAADVPFDADVFFGANQFQVETSPLALGNYKLSIRQTGSADAAFVPESGTLGLLGAGMAGLAILGRRRPSGR